LHVHPPGTKQNDEYKIRGNKDVWDEFCKRIEQSDVAVFGITDYFSADGYKNFIEKYKRKYPKSKKNFFLNIELRLNESVNRELEEVNIHLVFNPSSIEKVDKFLNELKVVKTVGRDQVPVKCSELKTTEDYDQQLLQEIILVKHLKIHLVKRRFEENIFLFLPLLMMMAFDQREVQKEKELSVTKLINLVMDFFGGIQNQEYFQKINRLEEKEFLTGKKPVISGSDVHSFDDMEKIFR
jgi:hypothetical protein